MTTQRCAEPCTCGPARRCSCAANHKETASGCWACWPHPSHAKYDCPRRDFDPACLVHGRDISRPAPPLISGGAVDGPRCTCGECGYAYPMTNGKAICTFTRAHHDGVGTHPFQGDPSGCPVHAPASEPAEAWLARRLGHEVQQGWMHACPYCPGCVEPSFGVEDRDLTDNWYTEMLVVKEKGADYWQRVPIGPDYTDAEAFVIEGWIAAPGFEVRRGKYTESGETWYEVWESDWTDKAIVERVEDPNPKHALHAAIVALRKAVE